MITVDHRFALSNPALLSALSKKSFSSASSPIFACSAFISVAGAAGAVLLSAPNTSAALLSSCAFQVVIWFGWTSNCSANYTRVLSPLIAAKATFALKAGECFRRGLLFMDAPDSRAQACPLSGRDSTYRTVRKCGATYVIGCRMDRGILESHLAQAEEHVSLVSCI
jgi:hypothetical protein